MHLTEGQLRYRRNIASYRKYRKLNRNRFNDLNRFGGNRIKVLERDNYICQKCGMSDEEHYSKWKRHITVDHVDGNGRYSDVQNNDLDNLLTLCLSCHGRKDTYRRKNIIYKERKIV